MQLKVDARGYLVAPTARGEHVTSAVETPDPQASCTHDWQEKQVLCYHQGYIYAYNRDSGSLLQKVPVTVPGAWEQLHETTMGFSGISGMEYMVFDFSNLRVYFLDKSGQTKASVQLPPKAAVGTQKRFSLGFSHNERGDNDGLIWLLDCDAQTWNSYEIYTCTTDVCGGCENRGLCIKNLLKCDCENFWVGDKCEVCPAGYSGAACDTDIDECASTPCKNGATCQHGINSFNCTCLPGYKGADCGEDIDECEVVQPCQVSSAESDGYSLVVVYSFLPAVLS